MNGAQGFPNPNNETLQLCTTIEGTHKPVQPFFVIALDHKNVATAQVMLSCVEPDSTICIHLDTLLI